MNKCIVFICALFLGACGSRSNEPTSEVSEGCDFLSTNTPGQSQYLWHFDVGAHNTCGNVPDQVVDTSMPPTVSESCDYKTSSDTPVNVTDCKIQVSLSGCYLQDQIASLEETINWYDNGAGASGTVFISVVDSVTNQVICSGVYNVTVSRL